MRLTGYDLYSSRETIWAFSIGFAFTLVRWVGNRLVLGHYLIEQRKEKLTQYERLFEEVWLLLLSGVLLVASWSVFLGNDVGATLLYLHPIVRGWPENSVTIDVVYLLRIEAGWYLHQVTRSWTASAVPLDNVMFYHHVGTILIIRFCLWKNLLLCGVLTVSVFNISNPFLHLSKIAYVMDWRVARVYLFSMFGLAFFISRIIMLPMTIMKMGYVDAYKENVEAFNPRLLLLGNVMMLILYGLQIFWMAKIMRVLCEGRTGSTPKKSQQKKTVFSDTRPVPVANGKPKEH